MSMPVVFHKLVFVKGRDRFGAIGGPPGVRSAHRSAFVWAVQDAHGMLFLFLLFLLCLCVFVWVCVVSLLAPLS